MIRKTIPYNSTNFKQPSTNDQANLKIKVPKSKTSGKLVVIWIRYLDSDMRFVRICLRPTTSKAGQQNLRGIAGSLFARSLPIWQIWKNAKQLIRASGSTAANYLEANEALSKKDSLMRLKISRKEVKESRLWLTLISANNSEIKSEKDRLLGEANELLKILSTIINKLNG